MRTLDAPAPTPAAPSPPFSPPERRIDFLAELFAFQADFDERAVNYPASLQAFGDGVRDIAVLTHASRVPFIGSALTEQLWDVGAADLHLLDAAARHNAVPLDSILSVDLTLNWSGETAATDGWRLIEAESTRDARFPVATGTVSGSSGQARARVMSMGRVLG